MVSEFYTSDLVEICFQAVNSGEVLFPPISWFAQYEILVECRNI